MPCLSRRGQAIREAELSYASKKLGALQHAVTYLDAGAADALPAKSTATFLRRSGVGSIRGFFLNSTHYDWTSTEMRYGDRISRSLHGPHFVVSTAANGNGPLRPKSRVRSGNEVLCNPPGRALGPRPTTRTGDARADAFMWVGDVGRSGGSCNGGPGVGSFWAQLALDLAGRANGRLGPNSPNLPY